MKLIFKSIEFGYGPLTNTMYIVIPNAYSPHVYYRTEWFEPYEYQEFTIKL